MPDRVESFGGIDSSEDHPRAQPGFVKSIQNELRKEQNLIHRKPFRVETSLAGRENGIRLQKEE